MFVLCEFSSIKASILVVSSNIIVSTVLFPQELKQIPTLIKGIIK